MLERAELLPLELQVARVPQHMQYKQVLVQLGAPSFCARTHHFSAGDADDALTELAVVPFHVGVFRGRGRSSHWLDWQRLRGDTLTLVQSPVRVHGFLHVS